MEQDTPAGYWVVRNLGRLRRKRDIACLGEMDTTSVVSLVTTCVDHKPVWRS